MPIRLLLSLRNLQPAGGTDFPPPPRRDIFCMHDRTLLYLTNHAEDEYILNALQLGKRWLESVFLLFFYFLFEGI